jgi:hypothetical protein
MLKAAILISLLQYLFAYPIGDQQSELIKKHSNQTLAVVQQSVLASLSKEISMRDYCGKSTSQAVIDLSFTNIKGKTNRSKMTKTFSVTNTSDAINAKGTDTSQTVASLSFSWQTNSPTAAVTMNTVSSTEGLYLPIYA